MERMRVNGFSSVARVVGIVALLALVIAVAPAVEAQKVKQLSKTETVVVPENSRLLSPHDAFKLLAQLDGGTWGPVQLGARKVNLDYCLTSRGSVVIETIGRGTPLMMVTIYAIVDNELIGTHYNVSGNITTMRLDREKSTPQHLIFDYVNLDNVSLKERDKTVYLAGIQFKFPDPKALATDDAEFSWGVVTDQGYEDLGVYFTRVHRGRAETAAAAQ